jgi:hypothetical protein
MIAMGVTIARPEKTQEQLQHERMWGWRDDEDERPPTFPEMLKIAFDAKLPGPEDIRVQPKWVLGGVRDLDCDFYKFVTSHDLTKHEGIILRHLLRLVILAGEFFVRTEDPDYQQIGELATRTCQRVDPRYTDRFLAEQQDKAALVSSS